MVSGYGYAQLVPTPTLRRYYSPYLLTDAELPEIPQTSALAHELKLAAEVTRPAHKRHERASDLLAGDMNKQNWPDPVPLYVCDRCFKYFSEVVVWEVHQVNLHLHGKDYMLTYPLAGLRTETPPRAQGLPAGPCSYLGNRRRRRKAILPKSLVIWQVLHRRQDSILRPR